MSFNKGNKKKDHFLLFIKDAVSVNSIEKFDVLRITDVFIVNLNNEINSEDIIQSNILLNNNNSHFVELRWVKRNIKICLSNVYRTRFQFNSLGNSLALDFFTLNTQTI